MRAQGADRAGLHRGRRGDLPLIGNVPSLARLLGVPYLPITPFFPLLGPLGLVPLPSKWIIEFGEPIRTDAYEPEAADDPMLLFNVTDQVRETIQQTLYAPPRRPRQRASSDSRWSWKQRDRSDCVSHPWIHWPSEERGKQNINTTAPSLAGNSTSQGDEGAARLLLAQQPTQQRRHEPVLAEQALDEGRDDGDLRGGGRRGWARGSG